MPTKITFEFTENEAHLLAHCVNSKQKQLERDIFEDYTPDTVKAIRKELRLELRKVKQVSYKLKIINHYT